MILLIQRPFTPEDVMAIENKMRELAQANLPVHREVVPRDEAIKLFTNMGEAYKAEIIAEHSCRRRCCRYINKGILWIYVAVRMCLSTGKLKAFKLTKLAGAYWRGDHHNEMLQRIYGTAWANQTDLQTYLERIAEAEKRDHRKLAKALDLFHIQEEAPGMIFWHPKGWTDLASDRAIYSSISTPAWLSRNSYATIIDRSLWEQSGHWEKFHEHMFTTSSENREYAIKPMNCPGHIQIFNQGLKSYRDLPLRFAEFGCCHRNETSGALHGLMRVRSLVQDDGHIFCTEEQIY